MSLPVRVVVALLAMPIAAYFIYGFGAGYFWPVALPTPLNLVATGILALLLLGWAWRYVAAARG